MNRFETAKRWRVVSRGLGMLLLLALGLQGAHGATNVASRVPSNRWLLVVQTTSSMAPRATEAANLAAALIASGMGGQMAPGDTLGLWTFDDSLHTGALPLQIWSPDIRKKIADRVYDFLKAQKFEKEGHLSYVLYDAQKVIRNSDFITVVLVTDGMEDIHGTPLDDKVNRVYQTWRKDQAKSHIPFITALRAEHGQLTNCAVTVPPWPLEMPPPSAELLALRSPKPPGPTVVTVTSAPVVLPPLIVSGKKREDQPPPAPTPQAGSTNVDIAAPPAQPEAALTPLPNAATAETAPKQVPSPPIPDAAIATNQATSGEEAGRASAPQTATNDSVASAQPNPPNPEPARPPAATAQNESHPVPVQATPSPVQDTDKVTLADLLSRKNGWIIPLGIAGLVMASFALGVVFTMFRRVRSSQRISLVVPKPQPESEKSEKKAL